MRIEERISKFIGEGFADVKSQWLAVKQKLADAQRQYDECIKAYDSTPKGTPEFIQVQKACWTANKNLEALKKQEADLRAQLG